MLSGKLNDGRVIRLWFTQRLFNALLGIIFQWLEQKSKTSNEVTRHVEQAFAQEAAVSSTQPQEAVLSEGVNRSMLVQAVDTISAENEISMNFRIDENNPNSEAYVFTIAEFHLRQWLHSLRALYLRAGWSDMHWPEWVKVKAEIKVSSVTTTMH